MDESDFGLKELKVIIYTNKVHLPSRWLNHRNFVVKHACWMRYWEFFEDVS